MNIRQKNKTLAVLALLLLSLSIVFGASDVVIASEPTPPGTGTPGYWKNHPEAWPSEVEQKLYIRNVHYTRDAAIAIMKTPTKGDKTYTMFRAWVATKLNGLVGNDVECIQDTWHDAGLWLGENLVGSGVKANSAAWQEGESLYEMLDDYNNGLLCAPSRD